MSQTPTPYGGTGQPGPYQGPGQPPGYPPGQPPGTPPGFPPGGPGGPPAGGGMGNKAKFWIGFFLGIPAVILAGFVSSIPSMVAAGAGSGSSVGGALSTVVWGLELVGLVLLIVFPRTRYWGIGLVAGVATFTIVAAGVCVVVLLVVLGGSH